MRMGAAYGRRHDFTGDVKVPDRTAACRSELCHPLRQIVQILEGLSREPESARDAGEIAVAEHRPILGHSLRAELVQFGAVRAVVHHDDQDVQPMALDGFKLLHVHHQAAVAVEQHDGSIRARRRHPMANEMPLPIAPNSRMVRNFSWGREGICAKNQEQWPLEFTISQSRGKASSSASTTWRGSSSPGSISKTWLSGFASRMRAAIASLRQLRLRVGNAEIGRAS